MVNEDSYRRNRGTRDDGLSEEKDPEIKELYKAHNPNQGYTGDETFYNIYRNLGLLGGPCFPTEGFPVFETCSESVKKAYEPIQKKIHSLMDLDLVDKILEYNTESLEDDQKLNVTADDIFALFLIENSKLVNEKFYKTLIIFVKLYRDCMNKLGWEILEQFKDIRDEPVHLEYTSIKNGEHLPDICNDFLKIYLPSAMPTFDLYLAAVIINHFCDWLYKFSFTHIKVKVVNEQ